MKEKYVIYRDKWVCGHEASIVRAALGTSELLNEQGRMCCIGQVCLQDGLDSSDLLYIDAPSGILDRNRIPGWLVELTVYGAVNDSPVCGDLMMINDDSSICQELRESQLIAIAKGVGVELSFEGELIPKKV